MKGITKGKLESLIEMITAKFGVISYIILGKTVLQPLMALKAVYIKNRVF